MPVGIRTSVAVADTALGKLRRDPLLTGANDGVVFLFDTAFAWCMAAAAPEDGDVIKDMSETGDGDFDIAGGQVVTYAGGGIDFNGLTDDPAVVRGPSGCLAGIAGAANDYFLVFGYEKLPISSDWNTNAALAPSFCCTTGGNGYATPEADLLTVAQVNSPLMTARRQTNGGSTVVTLNVSPALHYGLVTQWAFWRNASGVAFRLKSSAGETIATAAVGSNNSGDFSALIPQWGVPGSFNALSSITAHRNAAKKRLFRGGIEDLSVSGRDPATVMDADYARTSARGVFS